MRNLIPPYQALPFLVALFTRVGEVGGCGFVLYIVQCTIATRSHCMYFYISSHRYSCALKNCNVLPSNQDQHTVSDLSSGAITILSLPFLQVVNGEKKEKEQVDFQIMTTMS